MYTENFYYGKNKNPADALPKVGQKYRNKEQEFQQAIAQEMKEKEEELERQRNTRYFETTTAQTF